jgi:wobble nucleotide-excising tRNase
VGTKCQHCVCLDEPRDVTYGLAHCKDINLSTHKWTKVRHDSIMAANKALLKEIGQDIQKSRFSEAVNKAKEVLERDSKNYQALVTGTRQ